MSADDELQPTEIFEQEILATSEGELAVEGGLEGLQEADSVYEEEEEEVLEGEGEAGTLRNALWHIIEGLQAGPLVPREDGEISEGEEEGASDGEEDEREAEQVEREVDASGWEEDDEDEIYMAEDIDETE